MEAAGIKRRLAELNYDKEEYWVVAGAAMVLYGIKFDTPDIDLGCTSKMADQLEKVYPPVYLPDGTRRFCIDGDIEVFENWLSGGINFVNGIPVVSLEGLIAMKSALGREKDTKDINLINTFLRKNSLH